MSGVANVEIVRSGFAAALNGDADALSGVLAEDAQIVTFRNGLVSEIVVYPSDSEAIEAARNP